MNTALTTVTLNGPGGWTRDTLAEPTANPGLVVTPDVDWTKFTGRWCVTHAPSGLCTHRGAFDTIAAARVFAARIAEIPDVDWAALPADCRGMLSDEAKAAMFEAFSAANFMDVTALAASRGEGT